MTIRIRRKRKGDERSSIVFGDDAVIGLYVDTDDDGQFISIQDEGPLSSSPMTPRMARIIARELIALADAVEEST